MKNKLSLFAVPYVVWMALFVVAPIVMVVVYAFSTVTRWLSTLTFPSSTGPSWWTMESPIFLRPRDAAVAFWFGFAPMRLFLRVTLVIFSTSSALDDLLCADSAGLCDLLNGSQRLQTLKGCLYNIGGVIGAEALCTNVLDACKLDYRTDSLTCDDTGTGCGGL